VRNASNKPDNICVGDDNMMGSIIGADITLMEPAELDWIRLLKLTTAAPCFSISVRRLGNYLPRLHSFNQQSVAWSSVLAAYVYGA